MVTSKSKNPTTNSLTPTYLSHISALDNFSDRKKRPWEAQNTLSAGQRRINSSLASKRWKERNKEKCRIYNQRNSKRYRETHPDQVKRILANWYQKNRVDQLSKKKTYYQENKEKLKEKARENYKKAQERKKHRCNSCEAVVEKDMYYCSWCVTTYRYDLQKNRSSR